MNKRGAIPILAIVVIGILIFGFSGALKFIFFDNKMPYILGGIVIILFLLKDRRG